MLQSEYIDLETGYRYYSTRQFESLNTIRHLRVLDTLLDQIADFPFRYPIKLDTLIFGGILTIHVINDITMYTIK